MSTTGYSSTPLAKKLGLKENYDVLLVNEPDYYLQLFSELPTINRINEAAALKSSIDFIHLFCTTQSEFELQSLRIKPYLKPAGMLWVSWPKKTATIPSNLSRDLIREFLLNNGLVDVKVCAVDANWSGLKFVYRLKDRN